VQKTTFFVGKQDPTTLMAEIFYLRNGNVVESCGPGRMPDNIRG